ncbi:glycogen/starch/alpha-glucan phosphorylase [Sporomusa sp.]|uniref:glycogen/starch/alpha-glucan phosphorylase n=1 Tax=Sporomusa sp. TaxID=2078658 RepID=UPI002D153492|nr:glycogen/starch/alpha-glucan phosphorylase [Sporomusa sp.]HWR09552.1 glycogen/starch/alpha-glucan phosphorylase [Sporomusa sp.]
MLTNNNLYSSAHCPAHNVKPANVTVADFKAAFAAKLEATCGKSLSSSSDWEKFETLALLTKEMISKNLIATEQQQANTDLKQVYYLSIEFLLGRLLENNLVNLGIRATCAEALSQLGIEIDTLLRKEEDAGLGNGGLGRLAACYLDSMAALGLAGHGCGLRYRYGLFEQRIIDGYQHEYPDNWLKDRAYVWEYRRPDEKLAVRYGGTIRVQTNGKTRFIHENYEQIIAVPYDVPIVGYQNQIINTLRLWSAEIDISGHTCSRHGADCNNVIDYKHGVESLTDLLYPDDTYEAGKRLRLKQQYFLVSASLQSIMRRFSLHHDAISELPAKVAIHINDTHPSLAVPELMRILLDEYGLGWDEAWNITVATLSYTNHTILPEALEKWPAAMLEQLLPRIYMIIHEINERTCRALWGKYPSDWDRIRSMSIIADGQVHMAHLAIAGSHSVNGVARIHTEILKKSVMSNFYTYTPDKFTNVTNGITHRRWLLTANPRLADLISDAIGADWIESPGTLAKLAQFAHDPGLLEKLSRVKTHNKLQLAKYIKANNNIVVDINSIFDSHIKRIHAYKRQCLNILHIMDLYNRLRENPTLDIAPRTFIFAGKAAPGYYKAKKTIKLINTLADKINNDKSISDRLKVVFLENYNVSHAELIIPASDVSEQISTASREASGTGNMKFMMNGAVTIGTLDGANIEIRNAAGADNIFAFGLSADEVLAYYRDGGYNPWDLYHSDPRIKTVTDQLINGFFPVGPDEFRTHYDALLYHGDEYFLLKDFAAYIDAQNRLAATYRDNQRWQRMCLMNIAYSGWFSSDRTFLEYATGIWQQVEPIPFWNQGQLEDYEQLVPPDQHTGSVELLL